METTRLTFRSDGWHLDAALYQADPDPSKPLVIANSGFTGLKHIHPERFARFLTPRGYRVFAFDYRGFAGSEGRKGEVLLDEQARDIANAATFIRAQLQLSWDDLVLLGWGMGAGLVLEASRMLPRLRGIACLNGFYDNRRVQQELRGEEGFHAFQAWLQARAADATLGSEPELQDPFEIYPLDPVSKRYVDTVLRATPGYEASVRLNFAQSLLAFAVDEGLGHLVDTPLCIVHGGDNRLHPPIEAQTLYAKYPGPARLEWLEGAGHTEWMLDDHPTFHDCVARVDDWLGSLSA